jgi:hypothetical protein
MPWPFTHYLNKLSGEVSIRGEGFAETDAPKWKDPGIRVRGKRFELVKPSRPFLPADVRKILATEANKLGVPKLLPATALEILAYADESWDKRTEVVGFGSYYNGGPNRRGYPFLYKPSSLTVEHFVKWPLTVRLLAVIPD